MPSHTKKERRKVAKRTGAKFPGVPKKKKRKKMRGR